MSMELQSQTGDNTSAFGAKPEIKPGAVAPGQATGLTEVPVAAAAAQPEPKRFGSMTGNEKARNLAELMNSSSKTLKANGVSNHMEDLLAGVMMNEGGTNTRREKIGKYFNQVMMGAGGKDKGLMGQIDKVGLEKLRSDPAALAKLKATLGEDQSSLVDRALSGEIDLEGLKSKDPKVQAAAKKQLLESGIDIRGDQYDEYSKLDARQRAGEKLDAKDAARLKKLGSTSGAAMGYDSLDVRDGKAATMADTRGLSGDRFREIYSDSQSRFEVAHYRRWRDQYEQQTAANKKLPADKQKPIKMGTSIGDYTANDDDKEKLGQNYDLLADLNTSYAGPQVMGLYAHSGRLKANDSDGKDLPIDLAKLKAAGNRHHLTEEDLQLQIGMLRMKGINMGSTNMSAESMTDHYNGSRKVNKHWATYVQRLKNNVGTYQSAERTVDAEAAAKAKLSSQFAD
jgi:hypothetical protein